MRLRKKPHTLLESSVLIGRCGAPSVQACRGRTSDTLTACEGGSHVPLHAHDHASVNEVHLRPDQSNRHTIDERPETSCVWDACLPTRHLLRPHRLPDCVVHLHACNTLEKGQGKDVKRPNRRHDEGHKFVYRDVVGAVVRKFVRDCLVDAMVWLRPGSSSDHAVGALHSSTLFFSRF